MRNGSFKKAKYVLIPAVLIVIGIIVWINVRFKNYGKYTGLKYGNEVKISGTASLENNDGRIYVTTTDGMRGFDSGCGLLMDVAFDIDHPMTAGCGDVAAIADIGGTKIYVISSTGIPHSYQTDLPIVKMCVAQDGTTAVLLDNDKRDIVRVYNSEGELKVEIGTKTAVDGFPVDIALSRDGRKLATLYLAFEGENILSKVTFYNMDTVGKNFIENIVGQKIYMGEMAHSVDFMGNNNVALIFDNGFSLFSMREIPSLTTDERIKEKITDISLCDECITVITKGKAGNTLTFYGKNGTATGKITGLGDCESLTTVNGEALLIDSRKVKIYRMNGTVKLDRDFEGNGAKLYSGGGNNYFITDADSIRSVNLVK